MEAGAANKIAKWTGSNTLATGLIADDGTTVTVGNSGNLVVEGNTTLGDADTDSTTVKGPAVFEETSRFNVGISLGATTYGTAGQVLTSGGGAASVNTWTTPTTGTVESVSGGTAITISGTAVDPVVNVDYSGTDNIVLSAGTAVTPVGADTIIINDATTGNVVKALVSNLPFDTYNKWVLTGDTGTQDILSGNTVDIAGGTYITTAAAATDTLTITHDDTSRTDTTSTDAPAFGGTFDAVASVTSNTQGHVTAVDILTVTLPSPVNFTAATAPGSGSPSAGTAGYVPAPAVGTGTASYFLNGLGAMAIPPNDDGVTAVTATSPISSSGGDTPNITHQTSGVSAGTYETVTVDDKGHVTAGTDVSRVQKTVSKSLTVSQSWQDMFSVSALFGGIISDIFVNKKIATADGCAALASYIAQAGASGTWNGSVDSQTADNLVYNTVIDTANGELEVRFLSYNPSNMNVGYRCQARVLNTQGSVVISVNYNASGGSSGGVTFTDLT